MIRSPTFSETFFKFSLGNLTLITSPAKAKSSLAHRVLLAELMKGNESAGFCSCLWFLVPSICMFVVLQKQETSSYGFWFTTLT